LHTVLRDGHVGSGCDRIALGVAGERMKATWLEGP
jgi:hypothetical protein